MASRDDILILYRKAEEDIRLCELLVDKPEFSDEMFGFHLQQAVEKLLKSLLAGRGTAFPFSHNLYELVNLCQEMSIQLPKEVDSLCMLTPFATVLRYAVIPVSSIDRLDRRDLLAAATQLRVFCEHELRP